MTSADLPVAIERALPLFDPPATLDVRDGFLDLLGDSANPPPGFVQGWWESKWGASVYDHAQAAVRRVLGFPHPTPKMFGMRRGMRVLDVGCGPGDITSRLGSAVGPDGLVLGVDVAESMLRRAVHTASRENVGFLRADVRELPFPDEVFDLVTSLATLQLVPEPFEALDRMLRLVAPGGRAALLLVTVSGTLYERVAGLFGYGGMHFFALDEIGDRFRANNFSSVYMRQRGPFCWVIGDRGEHGAV